MSERETGALGPGRIEPREREQEMRSSYLDYAMSVIVGRALPDGRAGWKPVHRRVLHGNLPIYDTLVRMAQPFSLRSPLVDPQGHLGSVDDDPPAADRYTQCRLS